MTELCDVSYKLLIVGDSNTGKSCLMSRFTGGEFEDDYLPTIAVDYKSCTVELDGIKTKLWVWDTSGDPRFETITTFYYRGVDGILIAYSTTRKESFCNVPSWVEKAKKFGPPDVKLIIVGTGCDCKDREVDYFTARDFANEQQLPFLEVNAKDGTNIELAFLTLIQEIRHSLSS